MDLQIKNIYFDLIELSDLEMQKRIWLGNSPDTISSFTELYNRLFDDDNIDNFIDNTLTQARVPIGFITELKILREMLNSYEEGDKTDSEIIEDTKWILISKQAKKVILDWDDNISHLLNFKNE